jgi:rhodanese-related sulfurtransferase
MMLRALLTVGLTLSLGVLFGCETSTTERDVERNTISVNELRKLLDQAERKNKDTLVLLIDPRPLREFEQGHIPGAKNLTLSAFNPNGVTDRTLERYSKIVVYGSDPASAPARGMTKRLLAIGYDDVAMLDGGLVQWTAQGGEVVVSSGTQAQAAEPR